MHEADENGAWYIKAINQLHTVHKFKYKYRIAVRPSRLQNRPYFCLFKYVSTVKQTVCSEAENGERDWGVTLKRLGTSWMTFQQELPVAGKSGKFQGI